MRRLRFLIANAYHKAGRDELDAVGCSNPALLYQTMLQKLAPGCQCEIIYPADPGESLPNEQDLKQFDGFVWTGSSLTIHKPDEHVFPQLELTRLAYQIGLPQFGSCWGIQLAAVAAGGLCAPNPKGREAGISRKLALTTEGRGHPMFVGKHLVFDAFTNHTDEVTHLPAGALLLAGNAFTRIQAADIRYLQGSFWAVQYHPEYDLKELARLTIARKGLLMHYGMFQGDDDADRYIEILEALAQDPSRKDLAWQLGMDEDVMNPVIRWAEVRNWIQYAVRPGG